MGARLSVVDFPLSDWPKRRTLTSFLFLNADRSCLSCSSMSSETFLAFASALSLSSLASGDSLSGGRRALARGSEGERILASEKLVASTMVSAAIWSREG